MTDEKPPESGLGSSIAPPKRGNPNVKYYAVIVALLVIAGAFAFLYATKSTAPPTSVGTSATIDNVSQNVEVGTAFSFQVVATGTFNNITVWWGDGTTQLIKYDNSTTVTLTHTYTAQGEYMVLYQIHYSSSTFNGLLPVSAGYPSTSDAFVNLSYAFAQLVANATPAVSSNPLIFGPGANLTYQVSYSTPSNIAYETLNLTVNVYSGTNMIETNAYPLVYSSSAGGFVLPQGVINLYLTNLAAGYYTIQSYVTVGTLVTSTVTAPVTNVSAHTYTAGTTAYFNNTTYTLGDGSLLNSTPSLALPKTTAMDNYAGTNVTYATDTNVTYGTGAEFLYPDATTLTLPKGVTLTYNTATNISVAANTNVTNTSALTQLLKPGITYYEAAGNYTTILNATTLTIANGADVSVSDTGLYLGYSAGQSLEYLASASTTYNVATSLSFTNMTNWVKFTTTSKVNVTSTVLGTTTVYTGDGNPGSTGDQIAANTTVAYTDIPIFSKITPYAQSASNTFFDALPNAPGGYTTLDPAISFYTASNAILLNTMLQLDQYLGNSTSTFMPELAAYLPNDTNGGVNTGWQNFTAYTLNGADQPISFPVTVAPGTNFTYHITNKIRDITGHTINAYDVYYTFLRDMLFSVSSPGTGGYLLAEYFFSNYSSPTFTPTYQGIMPNVTFSNTTDNFTVHFAQPMPTLLVEQLFAASGTYVEAAPWFVANGAGITFTPAGFAAYTAQGNLANYNTYVQNHIDANGPYEVSLVSPAQFVVLVKNPNFQGLPDYPAASVSTVVVQYTSSISTAWLEFKSGQAQDVQGMPPTYWNETVALKNAGKVIFSEFPTISIYFYNFNMNIDETTLHTVDSKANVPANFMMNQDVREAFSFAYNYSYYYGYQVGNAIYNHTFAVPYAGMLVPGLPDSQNISQLQSKGVNVPIFDLQKAKQYWDAFMSDSGPSGAAAMGITGSATTPLYKGNPLDVPIFIPQSDPTDQAGATTWGQEIQTFITNFDGGKSVDVQATTLTNIFRTWAVPGADPMPVSWGGWAPDYPYPTDYLAPMFLPVPSSTYLSANSWNASFVSGQYTSLFGQASISDPAEALVFNQMVSAYNNGTANATNAATAKYWFQKVNEIGVNLSPEVYIGQTVYTWTWSSICNQTGLNQWQTNIMIGGGQEIMYNYVTYT